jgi:F-type H+-transporting ATPase subunit alpha
MRLEQGERIVEVLKQDRNAPVSVEHQVVIIYAVINGYLKDIAPEDIKEFEKALYDYVDNTYPKIVSNIAQSGALSEETEEMIKTAVTEYTQKFLSRK